MAKILEKLMGTRICGLYYWSFTKIWKKTQTIVNFSGSQLLTVSVPNTRKNIPLAHFL